MRRRMISSVRTTLALLWCATLLAGCSGLWVESDYDLEADNDDMERLVGFLEQQTWSEFAVSLARQYRDRGRLSPKQIDAGRRMMAKIQANEKKRQEAAPCAVYPAMIAAFSAYSEYTPSVAINTLDSLHSFASTPVRRSFTSRLRAT